MGECVRRCVGRCVGMCVGGCVRRCVKCRSMSGLVDKLDMRRGSVCVRACVCVCVCV